MTNKLPLVMLCNNGECEEPTMNIDDAIEYVIQQMLYLPTERYTSIQCKNGKAVNYSILHIGTMNEVSVSEAPRDWVHILLQSDADEVVIIHTHPDWNPTPSNADLAGFYRTNVLAYMLNVRVRDFIVISDHGEGSEVQRYSVRKAHPEILEIPQQKENITVYNKALEEAREKENRFRERRISGITFEEMHETLKEEEKAL